MSTVSDADLLDFAERWLRELAEVEANGKVPGYLLAEYDARGHELERLRAELARRDTTIAAYRDVLKAAETLRTQWLGWTPSGREGVRSQSRIIHAVVEQVVTEVGRRAALSAPVEAGEVCRKCGTAACLEDARSGWYDDAPVEAGATEPAPDDEPFDSCARCSGVGDGPFDEHGLCQVCAVPIEIVTLRLMARQWRSGHLRDAGLQLDAFLDQFDEAEAGAPAEPTGDTERGAGA